MGLSFGKGARFARELFGFNSRLVHYLVVYEARRTLAAKAHARENQVQDLARDLNLKQAAPRSFHQYVTPTATGENTERPNHE